MDVLRMGRLRAIDIRTLTEAAQSMGAGWGRILWAVILPNLRGAVAIACLLCFVIVLGEYTIASIALGVATVATGGALGLLIAPWGTQLLLSLAPEAVRATGVHTNARVLLFTLAASVTASLLAGILPVLRVTPRNLDSGLRRAGGPVGAAPAAGCS